MIFNVSGGGGTALNFRVVGGTTAPTNPAENCIWVNTDTPITSWIFSATQPSPAEPGMVWISTGTSSIVEFNSLKKNGIQVYPVSAKQYISGAWVDKTAKSYQGGEWVDWWRGELYKNGNTYDGITGGWEQTIATNGTVTFNRYSIKVSIDRNANGATFVGPKNAIDLTNYNTLSINVTDFYGVSSILTMFVNPTSIVSASGNTAGVGLNKKGIISLDVSELTGLYYIGVGGGWYNPCSVTFNEVMLS